MKIAINRDWGGFSVSAAIYKELGIKYDNYGYLDNKDFGIMSDNYLEWRSDPRLIAAIEKLGEKESSGKLANIKVIDVPDDIEWNIDEYDGVETVEEKHRSW